MFHCNGDHAEHHLKGKIQAYEILNEPNLHLWPANYNTYLASAVKAIRKADPAAKIAAFCLTSDFGADGTGWLDECIRLGGFRNIDIAGFHPYSSRELASPLPADLTIETFRKQVRAVADIPLWNTELYYLYDVERGKPEMKQKAYHCAWRFLVDLGEGVGQSPFISSWQIFRNVLVPEFPYSSLFDTVPNESAVVFNAMARLFEGARPVLKRKFDQGIILYGFERRDGRLIAALWNFRYRKGLRMDLRGLEVLDMFGNPLKAGILPVGVEPFYLLQGAMSRGEFLRKLESLKPLVENPVAAIRANGSETRTRRTMDSTSRSGFWRVATPSTVERRKSASIERVNGFDCSVGRNPRWNSVSFVMKFSAAAMTSGFISSLTIELHSCFLWNISPS